MEGVAGNRSERDSLIRNGLWKVIFSLSVTEPSCPCAGDAHQCSPMLTNARRPSEWSIWATSCLFIYLFIFDPKSRDLSPCSGVQKLARTQTHTSGITAQTWRQRVTNSPLLLCHSAAPLEQMGDECWREERTLFINSFFFLPSPSAHIFPRSRSCYMNHSLTSPQQTNFCHLIIAAALSARL